jgi:sodium/proline symporter
VPDAGAAVAAEQTLPMLAKLVLPEVWLGTLLAGVFAATMSTADSQLLACSAAVTQDIVPELRQSYVASKAATLAVAVLASLAALYANEGVFELVLGAWSALGAALGPLLVVRIFGLPISQRRALAMMALGLFVELSWTHASLSDSVFELLPGLAAPMLLYIVLELFTHLRRATRAVLER